MPELLNDNTSELSTPGHRDEEKVQRLVATLSRRQLMLMTAGAATFASWSALLSGCGSSNRGPLPNLGNPSGGAGGGGNNSLGRGAVAGFAFLSTDGNDVLLFNTAGQGTAAGLQPAQGARAEIVGGNGSGSSATVGADGSLRLGGIAPGLRTLRLTLGGNIPPRDVPLTVPPDAVLPLGQTPVTRTQAAEAARNAVGALSVGIDAVPGAELLAGADILISSTPLPAGVVVQPAFSLSPQPKTLERPAWFVYVDFFPTARFGHDVAVVLVDAETGAARTQLLGAWPLLNGASFYPNAQENRTAPDAVQVATRTATRDAKAAPVAFGPPAPRSVPESVIESQTCRAADPDTARTHYLIVQGDTRNDFDADPPRVMQALQSAPFPQTGSFRVIRTFESSVRPREQILNAFVAVRDTAKSGDTLVVYVTSHGDFERDGDTPEERIASHRLVCDANVSGANRPLLTGEPFDSDYINPNEFDFRPCKACRIVLCIDTCYSGSWIPILRPQLEALPNKDILILTSANPFFPAQASEYEDRLTDKEGKVLDIPVGGVFTTSLLQGLSLVRGANEVENGADALASAFPFAKAQTTRINLAKSNSPEALPPDLDLDSPILTTAQQRLLRRKGLQLPQMFRRPLGPDEFCGKGDGTVSIL